MGTLVNDDNAPIFKFQLALNLALYFSLGHEYL